MKDRAVKILGCILVAVFVNFMFANTVFLHTHHGLAGRDVTHSHTYNPSANHTHSAQSFNLIAAFNAASASFGEVQTPEIATAYGEIVSLGVELCAVIVKAVCHIAALRAPPCGLI